MKGEIDRDFYCSAEYFHKGKCTCQLSPIDGDYFICALAGRGKISKKRKSAGWHVPSGCENYHRKWPTPEQFKQEYGEEYPDEGAVYRLYDDGQEWVAVNYAWAKEYRSRNEPIVCACTPWSCPPADWRPE